MSDIKYKLEITILPPDTPKGRQYKPITLSVGLDEYQGRIVQATPVGSVNLKIRRAGGILLDSLPDPVDFQ